MRDEQHRGIASELTDKLLEACPEYMRHDIAGDDWGHDPWGTNLAHWFVVSELLTVLDQPTSDSYSPGMGVYTLDDFIDDDSGEFYWHAFFIGAITDGHVTIEDIQTWNAALEVADHGLRLIGDGALTY